MVLDLQRRSRGTLLMVIQIEAFFVIFHTIFTSHIENFEVLRGCAHIMSSNFGVLKTPPSPHVFTLSSCVSNYPSPHVITPFDDTHKIPSSNTTEVLFFMYKYSAVLSLIFPHYMNYCRKNAKNISLLGI